MTGTEKFTWGIILNFGGGFLFIVGVVLSLTIIGAILGIPMILAGIPLMIWGIVWVMQGQVQKQQEAIASGVQQGLQQVNSRSVSNVFGASLASPAAAEVAKKGALALAVCPQCRVDVIGADSLFCGNCGTRLALSDTIAGSPKE